MIAILDYGAGNIHSVQHALLHLGYSSIVTQKPDDLLQASHVIVPGQGAFKHAMSQLHSLQLIQPLHDIISRSIPLLGICLGFQILFDSSEEHGSTQGLGVLPGNVIPFPHASLKVPHMGWNTVSCSHHPMFDHIDDLSYFYFVHSFCIRHTSAAYITGTSSYSHSFVSAIAHETLWATQFHPEKSSHIGLQLLKNFLRLS